MTTRALRRAAAAGVAGLMLAACGIPADPDGTLDRVREDGVLHAGASPRDGWVDVTTERPSGREPRLVEAFAADLGVDVEWTVAGEEQLVRLLEDGDLDLMVGGITDETPWSDQVGITRPYVETESGGRTEAHVMAVPTGENALLSELERWLDDQGTAS